MAVEQSILKATKGMLDVAPDDDSFDATIMTHINGALSDLNDLGVGPAEGLVISGDTEIWDDLEELPSDTERIKNWLYLKVRLIWDPPQTSFLLDAHNKQIEEATWRLVDKRDMERYAAEHPDFLEEGVIIGGGSP